VLEKGPPPTILKNLMCGGKEMDDKKKKAEPEEIMADQILNGDFCQLCGQWMEDEAGAGYPQTCDGCE